MRRTIAALIVVGSRLGAQATPTKSLVGDSSASIAETRPILGRNTRLALAGAAGIGAAMSLFDSRLSSQAQGIGGGGLRVSSAVGSVMGGPVPIALGATMYGFGRGTGNDFATRTGREVMRAVVVSGAITAVVKGATGRARPYAAPGDADMFSPGRGFANGTLASFPSGHTSAAFATATVLAREIGANHPRWNAVARPLLFGGATLVAFSRVNQGQHWPSDVVAGAALGTITGFEVVAHSRGDRSPLSFGPLGHLFGSVHPSWLSIGGNRR